MLCAINKASAVFGKYAILCKRVHGLDKDGLITRLKYILCIYDVFSVMVAAAAWRCQWLREVGLCILRLLHSCNASHASWYSLTYSACVWVQPSHELQNVDEVLMLLSKHPHGLMAGQIKDAYKGVGDDIKVLPCTASCCPLKVMAACLRANYFDPSA